MAVPELTSGYNEPAVTWLYRHHPDQTHRTAQWRTWSTAGRRIALQRAAAVRAAGLMFPTEPRGESAEPVDVGPLAPKKIYPRT